MKIFIGLSAMVAVMLFGMIGCDDQRHHHRHYDHDRDRGIHVDIN